MKNTKWICEIWWQNSDGDETSNTASFDTEKEAVEYGEKFDGTFNTRGRLAVAYETYEMRA